jgi:selenocysteine lyase/cysteine desulfurase
VLPNHPVYLDYNATTPVDARAAEAARPYWNQWFGNPSSDHAYGARPRQAVGGQVQTTLTGWKPVDSSTSVLTFPASPVPGARDQ